MVIAAYTLVDGLGARASGAPATYTAWILVGGGVLTFGWNVFRFGTPVLRATRDRILLGLAGGVMGFGAYAIALWAMTVAPIGAVAAVRESSVLFAAALGAIFLGERFGPGPLGRRGAGGGRAGPGEIRRGVRQASVDRPSPKRNPSVTRLSSPSATSRTA